MSVLKRYPGNPILEPVDGAWDRVSVFNPGAAWVDGRVVMLYRAVSDLGEYVSRLGLAQSEDGYRFQRVTSEPVLGPELDEEVGGIEDPRITPDDDGFLVTYAAVTVVPGPVYEAMGFFARTRIDPCTARPGIPPFGPTYTGLLRTTDFRTFERMGFITPPGIDDRDGVLFPERINGRYALLHRPSTWVGKAYGTDAPGMWLAFSNDLRTWDYGRGDAYRLMTPRFGWEGMKIGGGPPPVRTPAGWLVIYHGVDERYVYRVGAALLDLNDPLKVLGRTRESLMQPDERWEQVGVIPNVVFPTAAISTPDGELLIYYGGADRVIGLATADMEQLLDLLLS